MKTLIEKQAIRMAYVTFANDAVFYYNPFSGRFNNMSNPFDLRKTVDKMAWRIFQKIATYANICELKLKKEHRAMNRVSEFKNVLQNPIYLDYKENKPYLIVTNSHLHDTRTGRNHWARTGLDLKVLSIISR